MTLPLYDREAYKSGDTVTLPFVTIDGVGRVLNGKIRGTSLIAQRRVLVIDFAVSSRGDNKGKGCECSHGPYVGNDGLRGPWISQRAIR